MKKDKNKKCFEVRNTITNQLIKTITGGYNMKTELIIILITNSS